MLSACFTTVIVGLFLLHLLLRDEFYSVVIAGTLAMIAVPVLTGAVPIVSWKLALFSVVLSVEILFELSGLLTSEGEGQDEQCP